MKISTEQVSIAASQRYVYQRYMLQVQISYKITKAACNDESSQKKKKSKISYLHIWFSKCVDTLITQIFSLSTQKVSDQLSYKN